MTVRPILFLCAALARIAAAQTHTGNDMLEKSLRTGDLNTITALLSSGLSPDARDRYGDTPLYLAMLSDNPRAVELLLSWHADPNAPLSRKPGGHRTPTPIQYAAREGDLRIVSALIVAGAQIDDPGTIGRTALHVAVESNHLDITRLLLEKGAGVNTRDAEGASPLDEAVWRGYLDVAAILLAHGAHLNDPDTQTGATPINEAAFRGHASIVQYLLRFHPDLTVPDKRGYTALENATRLAPGKAPEKIRRQDAALMLLDATPPEQQTAQLLSRLMAAAIGADEPLVVEALVRRGVSVNAALPSGYTPLGAAASTCNPGLTRALLDHGADPNLSSTAKTTPLEDAALKGYDAVVALLVDHGGQVNAINADSQTTALYAAAAFGRTGAVTVLLEKGAKPNLCGPNRKTALQAATENGYIETAERIRAHGGSNRCE